MALTCTWDAGVVVCHIFQSLLYLALHFIKRLTWLGGGNHVYVCVCVYAKISRVYRVVFFNWWMKSFYLWKMYTDISVSIKCDICNQSQKKLWIYGDVYTNVYYIRGCTITPTAARHHLTPMLFVIVSFYHHSDVI